MPLVKRGGIGSSPIRESIKETYSNLQFKPQTFNLKMLKYLVSCKFKVEILNRCMMNYQIKIAVQIMGNGIKGLISCKTSTFFKLECGFTDNLRTRN